MQDPPKHFSTIPPAPEDYRARLIDGMSAALVTKSYAEVTIADIVTHSRVSKRTFYEHFPDKEACFLATYQALVDMLLQAIAEAVAARGVIEAVDAAVHAYFAELAERADLIRPFFTDIQAAGPAALKLRRQAHQRFADLMRELVEARLSEFPDARPLSPQMATALVGGINELVLMAIEEGRAKQVTELSQTAIELLLAVLSWKPATT